MSPRPTCAVAPCASIVASRSLGGDARSRRPVRPTPARGGGPTSSSTPRPVSDRGHVLDAGDEVALARDDAAGRTAVPRHAVVEDVAEAVPLGRACSGMATTSSAPPMPCGKPWLPASASRSGVEHRVHGVRAPAPAVLGAVHVERLREARSCARAARALRRRRGLASSMKFSGAERVVLAPAAPVAVGLRGCRAISAVRVGAVELRRDPWSGRSSSCLLRDAASRAACRGPRWSRSSRRLAQEAARAPGRCPAGLPVKSRSPGSSGMVCEAPAMSAGTSKSRSLVVASCIVSPFRSRRSWKSSGRGRVRARHRERARSG